MTVSRELSKYKLDLVGVQEVKWEGAGTEPIREYTCFYGKGNENLELGTGFFLHKRIISAVMRVEFVSDRMSYIILRGRWSHVIVLNVHVPTEDKTDDVKDSFYEELERVFDKFPKHHMKILLGDFIAKVGREDIFKMTIGNESLHEVTNDNGVRLVNAATSKNLRVKSTVFPHRNIHKYTWTSPGGKTHNQIGHILVDRRKHSSILDARLFRAADCDIDHVIIRRRMLKIIRSKETS
jgi:exonuclease III